jgi:23S rRNA (cytosine1962-C5)-methyltransferase
LINEVVLKPGRDKTARQFHPWIFSGAIAKTAGSLKPGEIVRVLDNKGEFVAYGYFNSSSQIRVRLLEWDEETAVDDTWWYSRLQEAISRRENLFHNNKIDAYRLVYGESDFLPGLIVDKYADYIVIQILSAGIENIKRLIIDSLEKQIKPNGIFERSDSETRALEGLSPAVGLVAGNTPPDLVEIVEYGLKFLVDIKSGQKTGFYLDQRDNRQAISEYANECEVLDCFSYSGAFAVNALAGGADNVVMVDSSAQSLGLAGENIRLNEFDLSKVESIEGDVFKMLRAFRSKERKFDMIILDPPKFAPTKSDLKRALSGYKDINLVALSILKPGGILATFSCSGAVDSQTLQTVLFWASIDIKRPVQILKTLSQGADHPRLVSFPESEYLKGFICRVL